MNKKGLKINLLVIIFLKSKCDSVINVHAYLNKNAQNTSFLISKNFVIFIKRWFLFCYTRYSESTKIRTLSLIKLTRKQCKAVI